MVKKYRFLFDDSFVRRLFFPILTEQAMGTLVGIVGTLMVGYAGTQALSAVGIVNSLNYVVINAFSSLASGAGAVLSQLLGAGERKRAGECAGQFLLFTVLSAACMSTLLITLARPLLSFLFGEAERAVLDMAYLYLVADALSFPFMVVVTTLSGVLRACGNSRTSMWVSLFVNILNAGICAVTIYGMNLGVRGAAAGLLSARVIGAIVMLTLMFRPSFALHIRHFYPIRWGDIRPILTIGMPMALDSTMFNGGKLLVQVFMSGMGTAVMAANAVASSVTEFIEVPSGAVSLMAVTLVGQSVGACDEAKARRYMISTTLVSSVLLAVTGLLMFPFSQQMCGLFTGDAQVRGLAAELVVLTILAAPLFWSSSFVLPSGLRAAGDVRFPITVSIISMWTCRVGLSWLFGVYLGGGVVGIWCAMYADWVFRSAPYIWRLFRGGWRGRCVVKKDVVEAAETISEK